MAVELLVAACCAPRRLRDVPVEETLYDFDLFGEWTLCRCVEATTDVVRRRDDPTRLPGAFSSNRRRELDDRCKVGRVFAFDFLPMLLILLLLLLLLLQSGDGYGEVRGDCVAYRCSFKDSTATSLWSDGVGSRFETSYSIPSTDK